MRRMDLRRLAMPPESDGGEVPNRRPGGITFPIAVLTPKRLLSWGLY